MKRVLVGFECSGVVRSELRNLGHNAWSCDIQPADDRSPFHLHMDIREALKRKWDAALFHPVCTYLTGSAEYAYGDGPYHQKMKPGTLVGHERRSAREDAIEDVKFLWSRDIPIVIIENPVGCLSTRWMKPSQYIQPYEFGDDASKNTCLWIRGAPLLVHSKYIEPRIVNGKKRWGNQTDSGQNKLSPGESRSKDRSRTYPGIGRALALSIHQAFQLNINKQNK